MQRLRYIRTGCLYRNNDSLAIAINKVEHRLTFSAKLIKSAVIAEGIGIVEDTRDFLADNRDDSFINRKSNGTRRKCVTIFLKEIRQEYAERLKQGMFGCPTYLLLLATYQNIFPFLQLQDYRDNYGEYWHVTEEWHQKKMYLEVASTTGTIV